jgi:hypothetical protein
MAAETGRVIYRIEDFHNLPSGEQFLCIKVFFLSLKNTRAFQSFLVLIKRKTFKILLNRPTFRKSNY